ncbi:MAG: hypothetical protein II921_08420 [Treponema sp.]|nr:hypothetical protein [Treponema sp.]
MFTFFLKKNFSDGWENFFFLILQNVFPLAIAVISYFALKLTSQTVPLLQYPMLIVCAGLFSIVLFSCGMNAAKIANYEAATLSAFFTALKHVWKIGFAFGVFYMTALLLLRFGISYYLTIFFETGSAVGILFTAVLSWFTLISAIALQWFIPLYFLQDENNFSKCLKKSFIIFFDNAGFSVLVFLYNILLFLLSLIVFTLIPGMSGLVLSCTNALRLRLYKYDWIEQMNEKEPGFENDRDKRSEVPWDELLAEDRETLGPMKLGNIIFPWK